MFAVRILVVYSLSTAHPRDELLDLQWDGTLITQFENASLLSPFLFKGNIYSLL